MPPLIPLLVLVLAGGLQWSAASVPLDDGEEFSGGQTTVFDDTRNAFSLPAHNLKGDRKNSFFVGNSFFNQNWVIAPASTAARDGVGPLFNQRSCSACHFKDGRSQPPEPGRPMSTMLLRISLPASNSIAAPKPDLVYGDQIQGLAIPGAIAEAEVYIDFTEQPGAFPDGETYSLRAPRYRLEHLGYGPPATNLLMSGRVAPPMIGLGLLEAISEATLRSLSDPDDRDQDGISGRVNWVWNQPTRTYAVGRFGWKAEQPTVFQQSAGAFLGDMGITSALLPEENHTRREKNCSELPNGGKPEVSDPILADVVYYSRTLAVPARRNWRDPQVTAGQRLFTQAQCAKCHLPQLTTGDLPGFSELSQQVIRPYTDLLLHDMGEGLSDHRPAFHAEGREWRTPPLWGIGLTKKVSSHTFFLHDGRARNLTEAILWHGGEAASAREFFRSLPPTDRAALLAFLESL
jgi:CxxC motif-containing protein (DUF1111 family)